MRNEINYSSGGTAVKGDSRRAGPPAASDQVKRAAAAFGGEGQHNGVLVGFGVANEVPHDEGAKGNGDSPDGLLFHVTLDVSRLGKQLLARAMAHVGTHIADVRDRALTMGLDEAESRAWQTTFAE